MTKNRGRKELMNLEQTASAHRQLVEGYRVNLVAMKFGVSRQVIYSAFRRYGYEWPVKPEKKP